MLLPPSPLLQDDELAELKAKGDQSAKLAAVQKRWVQFPCWLHVPEPKHGQRDRQGGKNKFLKDQKDWLTTGFGCVTWYGSSGL
jgi:hypothetical protein